MELYSQNEHYKLYHGNMLDMLEVIEPNSIDSIITDPPYGLTTITKRFGKENSAEAKYGNDGSFQRLSKGFMGKEWDGSGIEYNVDGWRKCYEVLKPGGYLLAFGGSRTFHRIACAIEDAGFEIRDTIMWLYGCLSNDTEILTLDGWKKFYQLNTQKDVIRIYDIENGIYKWEKPERWNIYKVNGDTLYNIKSDTTDQLVSRNHRCLIERNGKLVFEFAENLSEMERVPILSQDIRFVQKSKSRLLLTKLLWQIKGMVEKVLCERERKTQPQKEPLWGVKSLVERWRDLSKQKGQLRNTKNTIRKMPERLYINGKKRRLCNGAQVVSSSSNRETVVEDRVRTPYQSQCRGQQDRESNVVFKQRRTQKIRERAKYNTTLARVTPVKYSGTIFCPTVSTGCFVARRKEKVFITGNSGFPKSMNIGLMVDKKNEVDNTTGNIRTDGKATNSGSGCYNCNNGVDNSMKREYAERIAQNEWRGWGTALKPSYEPVIVARKPCEGSCIDNVLKWGVGGLNIDECRIGNDEIKGGTMPDFRDIGKKSKQNIGIDKLSFGQVENAERKDYDNHFGRYPSNTILTYDETDYDEVCGGMPDTESSGSLPNNEKSNCEHNGLYNFGSVKTPYLHKSGVHFDDEGSAARYFYCAKASKRDRDEGLNEFDYAQTTDGNIRSNIETARKFGANSALRRNTHPTVKPTDLMQYLIRLVTPRGGTILDCFNGSGSTGKAAMYENKDRDAGYKYIGIELTEEYLPIAKARIEYAINDKSLSEEQKKYIEEGQMTLFE